MKTSLFDFTLPPEYIATQPVSPRDAARMLVVSQDQLHDSTVMQLTEWLKPGDLLVFNDTKVIPARLKGKRGEASIEVTLHKRLDSDGLWSAFAKPGKKIRVGDIIKFADDFQTEVINKYPSGEIKLSFIYNDLYSKLYQYGEMPLPPYIKRKAENTDKNNYNTVYAKNSGAVAAPTAGLHFTDNLLEKIAKIGVKFTHVTLHVGGGTFLPVKAEDTTDHIMHSEYIEVNDQSAVIINKALQEKRRIIAVGTTSLRTLESVAGDDGYVKPYKGETSIFITPGYRFKVVDMLMTNFHLPRSTLFMLVSAFAGLATMQRAYEHAKQANYRFYSFGDACLLCKE